MIYLLATLISLRRKLSDKNKGTGATGMVFCSFTRCSLTVIAAMRINLLFVYITLAALFILGLHTPDSFQLVRNDCSYQNRL